MATVNNNITDINAASRMIGANRDDLQYLRLAREFNNHLKLDSTPLLFGLLKKGMKPKVSAIFTMTEEAIRMKIKKAIEQKIIPDSLDIDFQLYLLNYKVNSYIKEAIGDIFDAVRDDELSSLTYEQKSEITRKLIEYTYKDKDIDDDFFAGLTTLSDDNIKTKLKLFFNYRDLCYGNNSFINEFIVSGSLQHIDTLLVCSKTEILNKISNNAINNNSLPDNIKNETEIDKKKNIYARLIIKEIETRYPTRALFLKLTRVAPETITIFNAEESSINIFDVFKTMLVDEKDNVASKNYMLDVILNEENFNIEKNIGRDFMTQLLNSNPNPNPNADFLTRVKNEEQGFTETDYIRVLSAIQRLYYLAKDNKFEIIYALLRNSFCSAYDIIKAGRTRFDTIIKADIPDARQRAYIFNAAEIKVNKAISILSKFSGSSENLSPAVVKANSLKETNENQITIKDIPELENLFGSQDVTDTEHSESVLSPAAYLVDLLDLLKQIEIDDEHNTLFDKLTERRPEIELIPLDTKNTLTLVPYIDLIIEILENWIADANNLDLTANGTLWDKWETISNHEDLKAEPDRCAYNVYSHLLNSYSWSQAPFDLLNEEMRLYCRAMGIDRVKWAEIANITEEHINPYYDVLGFNQTDTNFFKLSIDETTSLDTIQNEPYVKNIINLEPDILFDSENRTFKRLNIKKFLKFSKLSLSEFQLLLDSYFINPEIIAEQEAPSRYSMHYTKKIELKNAYLEFLHEAQALAFVFTMYQFKRLQTALGWSLPMLDLILMNISSSVKTCYSLPEEPDIYFFWKKIISDEHIQQLGKIKKIQTDYQLSDKQIVALFGKICTYEYKTGQSYFNWMFMENNQAKKHKNAFTALMHEEEAIPYVNNNIFQEDGTFHPFVQYVCSIIQLSEEEVRDVDYLLDEVNENKIITKKGITNLIRYAYLLDACNISTVELNAFLKLNNKTALDTELILLALKDTRIIQNNNISLEHMLYLLDNKIFAESALNIPKPEEIKLSLKNLLALAQKTDAELEENTDSLSTQLINELMVLEPIDFETAFIIANNYYDTGDFETNIKALVTSAKISINQYDAVKNYLAKLPDNNSNDEIDVYKAELSKLTGIDDDTINEIFAAYLDQTLDLDLYLDSIAGLTPEALNDITSIQKAFLFAKQTNLSTKLLEDYFSDGAASPIDIWNLNNSGYADLRTLLYLFESKTYLKNPDAPFSCFGTFGNLSNTLEAYKWHEYITASDYSALLIPNENDKAKCLQWFTEFGKLADLTINPEDAINRMLWAGENFNAALIQTVKSETKDKLGIQTYRRHVSVLRDELRERQRDALVYYVTNRAGLDDSNDLFSWLLIDTQMTAAVSTSRIVQATLAVQLFIQRIQFNLEQDITLIKSDENRWKWMSLYRVWEANRKIFLYPENWLEPELRDDKSPFFNELEKDLTSNEITDETVQNAYYNYLKKVEKIADVEYCQMFNEEHNNYSVLHVIGRSRGVPHTYYYRKFVNESYWTAWEQLGFEINSEHLAPVVINDRLIIFWLEYFEETREPSNITPVNPEASEHSADMPQKVLSVQVCWCELKNNTWSEKKMLPHRINIDAGSGYQNIPKKALRLVIEAGQENFLYLLYDFSETLSDYDNPDIFGITHFERPQGYKFKIQVFNNVELINIYTEKTNSNNDQYADDVFKNIFLPDGVSNYYQKVKDQDGALSLHIPTQSGMPAIKQIADAGNTPVTVVYPHQYLDFQSQAPFILEKGRKSFMFIPVVQNKKNNDYNRQIRNKVESLEDNFNTQFLNETTQSVPEFFTDEDAGNTLVHDEASVIMYKGGAEGRLISKLPKYKTKLSVCLAYHPYVGIMRRNIERFGIEGLLDPSGFKTSGSSNELLQGKQANEDLIPDLALNKNLVINNNMTLDEHENLLLSEKFEFNSKSAFGIYNWEIFFHIPYMIANHFYIEGNYDEALKWIHYIFDPRETENADSNFKHFWKFKPFAAHNATKGIEDILFDINMDENSGIENNELDDALEIWSSDPFKPHNVARMRITAYMKATVMRYLDILVARGDQSFRVDTMESINEALQYYIIAAQILGREPEVLKTEILKPKTYKEFGAGTMGNAIEYMEEPMIKPENAAYLEKFIESNEVEIAAKPFSKEKNMKNMVQNLYAKLQESEKVFKLYFGVPKNEKMFSYWKLVGDRLFKIRNSMNIDGIKRTLSLFAPPIDPGMLASATAAGLDIKALVNGQAGPVIQYRFNVLINQALQLCGEIKSLSSQLLSAYEKEDSETISKLRAQHEILLSEQITRIREKAIEELNAQLEQLDRQKEIIDFRNDFYSNRKERIKQENQQLAFMDLAMVTQIVGSAIQSMASYLNPVPDVLSGAAGIYGSPVFSFNYGGTKLGGTAQSVANVLNSVTAIANYKSSRAGIIAGYERRKEEWKFQADMANLEYAPLAKQRLSVDIRKQMAEYELQNHKQQIANSKEAYELMKSKYSNEQLYNWMRKEIVQLQRKAYDMAYKIAKQAEKAYYFELNPRGVGKFISASHFDTKYEGMFAGEKLFLELKAMEAAYFENNKRKYELTKQISLALLNPMEIINLRSSGACSISIPELLFDLDYPNHCNRRIKSVSLTIPCVTGPYTSVSAELTLMESKIFPTKDTSDEISVQALITSMATSSGINDSGMFQLNFNDERYLPFEGAGVNSEWYLTLPKEVRQFDYNTINDVILTIQYTAEKAETAKSNTVLKNNLKVFIHENNNFAVFIDVKSQFPDVFETLKTEAASLTLSKKLLPVFMQNLEPIVTDVLRYEDNLDNVETLTFVTGNNKFAGVKINLTPFEESIPEQLILIVTFTPKEEENE